MNIAGGGNHGKQMRNHKFLAKYIESGSVAWNPGSGRLSRATAEVRKIIAMRTNNDDGESLPRELLCLSQCPS